MHVRSPAARELLAFEVVRATFEDGAFTERAFRAGGRRRGLERPRARPGAAARLRRRAAAGTTDAAIERLVERPAPALDPPVLAALRLGLYELLFADATPDHAAVDQAVELVKAAGAAHAAGLVNAVLRRAARERAELTASLLGDDSTPERGRGRPLGAALAGADVVGGARRRGGPLAARRLQRAGRGRRCGSTRRGDREAMLAALAEAGVEAAAAGTAALAARGARDARPRRADRGGGRRRGSRPAS